MTDPINTDRASAATSPVGRFFSRSWTVTTGDDSVRPVTLVAWLVLVVILAFTAITTYRYDFRRDPPAGDEVTFLFAGLSLAESRNLSYDAADVERWTDVGWIEAPNGLFFQVNDDGWAFAKPYGYSLYIAPAIAVLGVGRGIAAANSILFLLLVGVAITTLRLRFSGPVVPIVTGSFFLACAPYLYGYVIGPELFLALLVASVLLCLLLYWRTERAGFAIAAFALIGFAAAEKTPLLVLFLPVAIAVVWFERRRLLKLVFVLSYVISTAISILPYLYYSDRHTWNAYAGERYYSFGGSVPFGPSPVPDLWEKTGADEAFEFSAVFRDSITSPIDVAKSLFYYLFGRYTGMVVVLPTAVLLIAAVLMRRRHLTVQAWALLSGIAGYILFYVVVFTDNYYGTIGIGNRYFIQIAPSVVALVVLARVSVRAVVVSALVGAALGLVFLWPQHRDPATAWGSFGETTWVQRILPVERNQEYIWQYEYFSDPSLPGCSYREGKVRCPRP